MPPIDENPVSTIETIVEPSPEYEVSRLLALLLENINTIIF